MDKLAPRPLQTRPFLTQPLLTQPLLNSHPVFAKTLARITVIVAAMLAFFSAQLQASPLKPQASQNQKTTQRANHVACQEFYQPFFSKKMPAQCATNQNCTKRLITYLCQANSFDDCHQKKLWQPITDYIDLPDNGQLQKITRTPKHLGNQNKLLLCWHYSIETSP